MDDGLSGKMVEPKMSRARIRPRHSFCLTATRRTVNAKSSRLLKWVAQLETPERNKTFFKNPDNAGDSSHWYFYRLASLSNPMSPLNKQTSNDECS